MTTTIAWAGAILAISQYVLVSREVLAPTGALFNSLNLVAPVLIGISCWRRSDWPVLTLQVVWASVATTNILEAVI